MNLSVLSMGLIPLAWAYAITRYRLMDVDIIFQQGYVYTLATLAVIGGFYALIFVVFNTSTISPPAFVFLIASATFIFQPIRRWIQEQLDRWVFYRDRYDARLTLIEFARELSSETDQNVMLAKISDRLLRTLSIHQVGFFLSNDSALVFSCTRLIRKAAGPRKLPGLWICASCSNQPRNPTSFLSGPSISATSFLNRGRNRFARQLRNSISRTTFRANRAAGPSLSSREPDHRRRFSFERRS